MVNNAGQLLTLFSCGCSIPVAVIAMPMFASIKAFIGGSGAEKVPAGNDANELRLATAALLVEAASLDGNFDEAEREAISSLLAGHFDLAADEVEALIEEGKSMVEESTQLYSITRVIKDRFDHEERLRIIEMLWEVVYADGRLDDFESNMMRRVAGLIYISDRESGEIRKRVLQRLDLKGDRP